jgi:hypothetical protein
MSYLVAASAATDLSNIGSTLSAAEHNPGDGSQRGEDGGL